MTKELVSLLVWSILFFSFELPAHFWAGCPWYTLSRTIWNGESWWPPIAIYVLGFMVILAGHFELHWSARWLVLAGGLGVFLVISHALHWIR